MYRGIVYPHHSFKLKRHFQGKLKLRHNSRIEIKSIATPSCGIGYNTIYPTSIWISFFTIIQQVIWAFFDYLVLISEHKQSCDSQMKHSISIMFPYGIETVEKLFVRQRVPREIRFNTLKTSTILGDGVWTQGIKTHFFQYSKIQRL